jgi:hypothetical protein
VDNRPEFVQWLMTTAIHLWFLEANKDNPSLDARYYRDIVSKMTHTMPVDLLIQVEDFLDSKAGKDWIEVVRLHAMVNPYKPEE